MGDDPKQTSYRWDEDDHETPREADASPSSTDPAPTRVFALPERMPRSEPAVSSGAASRSTEPVTEPLTERVSWVRGPAEIPLPREVDEPSPWVNSEPNPVAAAAPPATEEADDMDTEPFDRPDAQKLGIVGGKGTGKTYLFQAMVYRCFAGTQSGALTYYLENDGMHLFIAGGEQGDSGRRMIKTGAAVTLNRVNFVKKYRQWERLAFTREVNQQWYRLRLVFRTGMLGTKRSAMDVEFFDGSGEGLLGAVGLSREDLAIWDRAYGNASVMVFCLPLWAAFPGDDLSDLDWIYRDQLISDFEQVIKNYTDMRRRHHDAQPVTGVLALTMADDRRSALQNLYGRWISPYLDAPHTYLRQLRSGTGIARYLSNARKVSEGLHEEFAAASDPRIASIPQSLDFGCGVPWIVALSAIDGARLDFLDDKYPNPDDPQRMREVRGGAPVPIHVELPLLVALCERENALM